jgi:hypothetical protein
VPGDPERVAIVAFAAIHGLVALGNTGMLDGTPVDDVIGELVQRVILGLRPR